MNLALPGAFLTAPLAHRGLHDVTRGIPENSRAAVSAAIAAGYGVEIDLQLSADGAAMVFHDYTLGRLTGRNGQVRHLPAADLARLPLIGNGEGIATFADMLALVGGRAPLLVELKDQTGAMTPDTGRLEAAAAQALQGYTGPVALMSFNPHSVAALARLAPAIPRGLTTSCFHEPKMHLPEARRAELACIPDLGRVGAGFVSHRLADLDMDRIAEIKAAGQAILCWTVKSPADEAFARTVADNITFEGYLPPLTA